MIANYHTHTYRCNHARGVERDYIETALRHGLTTLGFSDHAPYLFDPEDKYSGFRMKPEQAQEYMDTLRALREEYKGRIDIKIGFELEYYPKYFARTLDWMRSLGLDYLIMGQHFPGNEFGEIKTTQPLDDEERFVKYISQVIEGLETGVYSCIAHPDIMNFTGSRDVYIEQSMRLITAAQRLNVPIEYNMLGMADHRNYPNDLFFDLVAQNGNDVVLGCDAHDAYRVAEPNELKQAEAFLKTKGCRVIETMPLRPIR